MKHHILIEHKDDMPQARECVRRQTGITHQTDSYIYFTLDAEVDRIYLIEDLTRCGVPCLPDPFTGDYIRTAP